MRCDFEFAEGETGIAGIEPGRPLITARTTHFCETRWWEYTLHRSGMDAVEEKYDNSEHGGEYVYAQEMILSLDEVDRLNKIETKLLIKKKSVDRWQRK